jgi:hypothetical protein
VPPEDLASRSIEDLVNEVQALVAVASQPQVRSVAALIRPLYDRLSRSALSQSEFGRLGWQYDHAATPSVETEWSSMGNWEPDRWRQFLADERETAAAALRDLERAVRE